MTGDADEKTYWPGVAGEMAGRAARFDWSETPLGRLEDWPEGLRATVGLVLSSPVVASLALLDDRLLIYNDTAAELYGRRHPGALGRPLAETFPDSYPTVAALYDRAFEGEAVTVRAQPLAVGDDGDSTVFDAYLTPVRDGAGGVVGVHMIGFEVGATRRDELRLRDHVAASADEVQELKALQAHQGVLLHELQHRVRNMLAVVRGVIAGTKATSESVEDFSSHLDGRLNALARTQMVLTSSPGQGVDLELMVREELLTQAAEEERIEISGPTVELSPKAAEVLALAMHELATNAVKYGALTAPDGRVDIRWATEARDGQPWLKLEWVESGVRVAAAAPRREGFGTELIEMRVAYELRGRGALHFRPGGVRCEIEVPLLAGESILQTDAPNARGSGGAEYE